MTIRSVSAFFNNNAFTIIVLGIEFYKRDMQGKDTIHKSIKGQTHNIFSIFLLKSTFLVFESSFLRIILHYIIRCDLLLLQEGYLQLKLP